jgi:hypothetical protein
MKHAMIVLMMVFGICISGSVLACDGSKHDQSKPGANKPAAPAPSTAK